jgi:hypothetical protein
MRTLRLRTMGVAMAASLFWMVAPATAGGDAGCGLGSMLWDGQSGMAFNLFASTTNGWLGTQTAGITFGTSGCSRGTVTAEHRLKLFVASNVDQIAREMALGGGDYLAVVASLLEVAPEDRGAFYRLTQEKFTEIFSSESVTSDEVVASVKRAMAADPMLAAYVSS